MADIPSYTLWYNVIFHIQNKKQEKVRVKLCDVVQIFTELTVFISDSVGSKSCSRYNSASLSLWLLGGV